MNEQSELSLSSVRALYNLFDSQHGGLPVMEYAKRPTCCARKHPKCAAVQGCTLGRGFYNGAWGMICDRCWMLWVRNGEQKGG